MSEAPQGVSLTREKSWASSAVQSHHCPCRAGRAFQNRRYRDHGKQDSEQPSGVTRDPLNSFKWSSWVAWVYCAALPLATQVAAGSFSDRHEPVMGAATRPQAA